MSIMMELRQRYCICVDCSPGRCQGDCPGCSVRTHECRCAGCPRDPCAPDCRHPDCSRQDAGRAEANMAQRAGLLRWNRVVHETRIQEFHLFQHERGAEFTLVEPDGKRIARTGRELEAMTFRVWLKSSPLYRPPPDPLGLDRAARRQDLKAERGAGSGKASARRRRLREQRVRAGLHPDWGRIGPFQHGEHWNWARKGKRNAIRAEDQNQGGNRREPGPHQPGRRDQAGCPQRDQLRAEPGGTRLHNAPRPPGGKERGYDGMSGVRGAGCVERPGRAGGYRRRKRLERKPRDGNSAPGGRRDKASIMLKEEQAPGYAGG